MPLPLLPMPSFAMLVASSGFAVIRQHVRAARSGNIIRRQAASAAISIAAGVECRPMQAPQIPDTAATVASARRSLTTQIAAGKNAGASQIKQVGTGALGSMTRRLKKSATSSANRRLAGSSSSNSDGHWSRVISSMSAIPAPFASFASCCHAARASLRRRSGLL